MNNPYAPPGAKVSDPEEPAGRVEYAGFWLRVGATLIDSVLLVMITVPLLLWIYGSEYYTAEPEPGSLQVVRGPADFLISWVFPAVATVIFWIYRAATPGKMLLSIKIVDARTLTPPRGLQALIRYFGYIPSTLVLCLGFLWVAFDPRKQAWHDKIAQTLVIRK
jgi:uncharacterized RDD family membrane protein YckC